MLNKYLYSRIDNYFKDHGLLKSSSKPNIYILQSGQEILIIEFYVNDMIYTRNNSKLFQRFKSRMVDNFEMTRLRELNFFLGLEVC